LTCRKGEGGEERFGKKKKEYGQRGVQERKNVR